MKIIAYRGYSGKYPENTLLAFQKAMEAGSDGIQLDVHFTRDRKLVVIHDESVSRTLEGVGFVRHHTLQELQNYDIKGLKVGESQKLITLEDYFLWKKDLSFPTLIQLKNDRFFYPGMEEEVVSLVEKYEEEDQVILLTSRLDSLMILHDRFPKMQRALIIHNLDDFKNLDRLFSLELHSVLLPNAQITEKSLELFQFLKAKIIPYGVDTSQEVHRMKDLGFDIILTSFVENVREGLGLKIKPFSANQLKKLELKEETDFHLPNTPITLPKKTRFLADGLLGILLSMAISVGISSLLGTLVMNLFAQFLK